MVIFQELKKHINKSKIGQELDVNKFRNIVSDDLDDYNVLNIYLWGFEKAGVLEAMETKNSYIIKKKIPKDLSLIDFIEKTNGDNWKEWFIQVGE